MGKKVACAGCKKACSGEVLKVQDKHFHLKCFKCKVCKSSLAEGGYFHHEGRFYCPRDYQTKFGTPCAKCRQYVEGAVVTVLGKPYHQSCLICSKCRRACEGGQKVCVEGEVVTCHLCSADATGDKKLVAGQLPAGRESAVQQQQQQEFQSGQLLQAGHEEDDENDDDILLNMHDEIYECSGCGQELQGSDAVIALDKKWHMSCFKCKTCQQLLHGEYMGRDGWPYCEDDYQQQFGVTCVACGDYITGKVLQAGEKHFHPECSRCVKCSLMFGEGEEMYLQGTDIWHPACTELDAMEKYSSMDHDPDRYEPKYDPDFSGEIYIASYLPLPEKFDGYMKMPVSPRPPRSPHYHRPRGEFSYRDKKPQFVINPHRPGMVAMIDRMDKREPRPKSPHMNNEEPIEMAHFPNARPRSPGEKPPIEREDWPAPPYRPFGPLKWQEKKEDEEEEDEQIKLEKELLEKEKQMLEKVGSGIGDIFLADIKSEIRRSANKSMDPRNASRTPSAKRVPHLPIRYDSPVYASPSRHMNRPMPWKRDASSLGGYTSYRSTGLIVPSHAVPKPGYGLTPKSATLPGTGRIGGGYPIHDISYDSMDSGHSEVKTMDSSGSLPNGNIQQYYRHPGVAGSLQNYQKYPNAVHHRSSLPNVSSGPPKVYTYDTIRTSNYKLPDDVDRTHLERHVALEEFKKLFRMTPIEFYKLPLWKRMELKKMVKLF